MTCKTVPALDGGQPWIMCGDFTEVPAPPCSACGAPADLLCDGAGCDVPLCGGCTTRPGVVLMPTDEIERHVVRVRARTRQGWAHSPMLASLGAEPMDLCPSCALAALGKDAP